jgi:hypothetical protein
MPQPVVVGQHDAGFAGFWQQFSMAPQQGGYVSQPVAVAPMSTAPVQKVLIEATQAYKE